METPAADESKESFDLDAERLALALESTDLGFWDFDLVQLKGSFTKACAEIFGLPHAAEPGEISYAEWLAAIHPEDRARAHETATAAQDPSGDGIYEIEVRVRHPDGSTRWATAHGKIYFTEDTGPGGDQQRRAVRFVGIVRDVTQHRLQQQTIAENEQRFHRAIHEAPIPIMVTGEDGEIVELNQAWQEITAYGMEELATMADWSALAWSEQDGALLDAEINRLREGAETNFPLKVATRTKHGEMRSWLIYAVTLHHTQRPTIMLSALDVTAREKAEEERDRLLLLEKQARVRAEEFSRSKDQFIATLSHELRTPLNAIVGWTSLVRRSPAQRELVDQGLEIIERNARLQTELIADLLDLSRIASGNARVEMAPVDLMVVLEEVVQSLRPTAIERQLELQTLVSHEETETRIIGDKARLAQIFSNLMNNAIKFTPAGGRIEVRVRKEYRYVQVMVSDNGQGIAPDFLPRLFESYSQADQNARWQRGLGLGLAISKHLVNLQGGEISAASDGLGKGATFTVKFPLLFDASVRTSSVPLEPTAFSTLPPNPVPEDHLRGVKILLLDDNADARLLLETILQRVGASSIACESGKHALEMMTTFRPDVVISDILMPEMDGYAFIRGLRDLGPAEGGEVPVIALTAFGRGDESDRIRQAGFQLHIAKPIEPAELIRAIAELVRQKAE
ncbi:MAG: PAS domain S-box protein [Verrucomicrobia bacterium]|nr:PAS domain S-box protein [Verrucomicrobiota bacterium]